MSDWNMKDEPVITQEEAVGLLHEASTRLGSKGGSPHQIGGLYWRLAKLIRYADSLLDEHESAEHARFIRETHGTLESRSGSEPERDSGLEGLSAYIGPPKKRWTGLKMDGKVISKTVDPLTMRRINPHQEAAPDHKEEHRKKLAACSERLQQMRERCERMEDCVDSVWLTPSEQLPERGDLCLFVIVTCVPVVIAGYIQEAEDDKAFMLCDIRDQYGTPVGYEGEDVELWKPLMLPRAVSDLPQIK